MARDPKAEVEISAHSRGLSAKLREARAKFGTFGNELKKNVFGKDLVEKGFWSKGGAQLVGNLGANLAGGAAGAIGGFLVEQGTEVYNFEKALTRLGIAANKSPEEMRKFADSVLVTSRATGISRNNILGAARAYVALTGDMDGAAAASDTWARVAQATDSSIDDVARTAASLKQNLKINPADMMAAFSALAVQGKEGAIELKDLAGQLANIAPQWAMFKGGSGVQGLKEMGAALQVVKQGFGGDASETVTGLQSLLTAVTKNAGKFKAAGIQIFDVDKKTGAKSMKNVLDIVDAIAHSKLVNDPTKLEKAFGRVEAYRAFLQLSQNKDMLDQLIQKSGDTKVIANDLEKYLESPAGKIERSWENVKNQFAAAMTPARVEAMAKAFVALAEVIGATVKQTEMLVNAIETVFGEDEGIDNFATRMVSDREIDRAKNMTPAEKAKRATELDAQAQKMANGVYRDGALLAARRLRADAVKADPSLGVAANESIVDPVKFYTAATALQANPKQVLQDIGKENPQLAQILKELQKIAGEAQKQTTHAAKGTKVEVDGNAVVTAHKNASSHARRPGG